MKRDEFGVDLGDDIEGTLDFRTSWFIHFMQHTILRGRVITRFGGPKMCTLLVLLKAHVCTNLSLHGNMCRHMGREKNRLFQINASGLSTSNTFTVHGVSFIPILEYMAQILRVPIGWCHYLKRDYPILYELPSSLEISRLCNNPTLEFHTKVDKGAMLPLYNLPFDFIHKIILS